MPEEGCYVTSVKIINVEKRRTPTKHYVYVINAVWSDGKQQVICRRYSHFFTLQTSMIDAYPQESGVNNPAERILPFIPGKILFGRSNVREVALKRKDLISEYLEKLIELPEKIARCELVLDFLEATEEDVKSLISDGSEKKVKKQKTADSISDPILLQQFIVIANFKKSERSQVSLAAGDTVEVIEKHENGWWFVSIEDEQGWAPSSYLEPVEGNSGKESNTEILKEEEKFICSRVFKASLPDEISIDLGDVVDVVEKCQDGWWKIRLKYEQGYVPVAHLKKVPKTGLLKVAQPSPKTRRFVPPPRKNTVKRKINKTPVWEKEDENNKTATERHKPPPPPSSSKEEEEVIYVALSDFTSNQGNINIGEGEQITVLEKSPNGWWYVRVGDEEGWVPSTVAQRQRRPKSVKKHMVANQPVSKKKEEKEQYFTIGAYNAADETGISFTSGQLVQVIDEDPCGWWFVRINHEEGWAPSTFLEKMKPADASEKNIAKRRISNDICDIIETIPISINNNITSEKISTVPRNPVKMPKPSTKPYVSKQPPKVEKKPTIPVKSSIAAELEAKLKIGQPPPPKPRRKTSSNAQEESAALRHSQAIPFDSRSGKSPVPPRRPQSQAGSPCISNKKPVRPPPPAVPTKEETSPIGEAYVAMGDYKDDDEGMLTFKKGEKVFVMEKDDGGWWLAKCGDKTGWVPSNFLTKE